MSDETPDRGGKWKAVVDYLSLVGTHYFGMLVGAVRALVIPGLLDPAGYGVYKTLLLILVYFERDTEPRAKDGKHKLCFRVSGPGSGAM